MQSIQTKYIPPTNYRPSRVKAWCERGAITVSWDDGLDVEANHIAAADALVAKFAAEDKKQYGDVMGPWQRPRVCGGLPGAGYCHTFLPMDRDGKPQELCPAGTLDALSALVKWMDDAGTAKTKPGGKGVFSYEGHEFQVVTTARAIIKKAGAK